MLVQESVLHIGVSVPANAQSGLTALNDPMPTTDL
jgi:hypothetical protein